MWTEGIDIFETRLLRMGSQVYFGCGSIGRIDEVLEEMKKKGAEKLLLATGKNSYRRCGGFQILQDAFVRHNIQFFHYDGISANPAGEEIDDIVQKCRKEKVQGVLAMGGGSVINAGKIISVLLAMESSARAEALFTEEAAFSRALPLAVINLTHGTGSEVTPFAVLHIRKSLTPLISSPFFYPDWAIDDPMLTCSLPKEESKYVTMEALNYAIESAASRESNVLSILFAKETVRLIVKYLPLAEKNPQDLTARYFLMFAALLAGAAYDNSHHRITRTPIQHPVSTLKPELPHGQGLTAILPACIKEAYPRNGKVLSRILQPISPDLTGNVEEAESAAFAMENWLTASGMPGTLQDIGFVREDIDALVEASFQSPTLSLLLTVTPTEGSKSAVRALFDDAFTPGSSRNHTGREKQE